MIKKIKIYVFLIFSFSFPLWADSVRIKDIAHITGVRSNKLIGYGLVFGLAGTGDTNASEATKTAAAHFLTRLGIHTTKDQVVSGSIASVIASAELPAFAKNGDRIDIRISTNGNAKSLAGGTLLWTPLIAGDGKTYVVGQGAVIVGQATGKGSSVLTVATVPEGGTVEREFVTDLAQDGSLRLNLKKPDFTTNNRITNLINEHFKGFYAQSLDPASVQIKIPQPYSQAKVRFIAELENLKVDIDKKAIVVLNERTGTVVMGDEVSVAPISIAHGDLSISVAGGKNKENSSLTNIKGSTVGELVKSLNALGVKPEDLIGILQAIHKAGALNGDLEIN